MKQEIRLKFRSRSGPARRVKWNANESCVPSKCMTVSFMIDQCFYQV